MTITVDVSADGVRSPVSRARVAGIAARALRAEGIRNALVSIAFVTERAIAAMNRRHLGHRGATDVISFGFDRSAADSPVVGDIYIAPGVARANAMAHGTSVREEIARLIVHGVLHVVGYEHPDGADRVRSAMWRRQEKLLAKVPAVQAR